MDSNRPGVVNSHSKVMANNKAGVVNSHNKVMETQMLVVMVLKVRGSKLKVLVVMELKIKLVAMVHRVVLVVMVPKAMVQVMVHRTLMVEMQEVMVAMGELLKIQVVMEVVMDKVLLGKLPHREVVEAVAALVVETTIPTNVDGPL